MKITKSQLKQIISEAFDEYLEESPAGGGLGGPGGNPRHPTEQERQTAQDARQKKVVSATTSGAMLGAEQYVQMLKQVLLTTKIAPQARKQALEAIFGQKGAAINTLVLQMLKGAQE